MGNVEPGNEGDYLDGPVLAMEAVITLLDVAISSRAQGREGQSIRSSVSEPRRQISTATPSASAHVWCAMVRERRSTARVRGDACVRSRVYLRAAGSLRSEEWVSQPQTFTFKGTLDYPPERTVLPDDFDLAEWNVLCRRYDVERPDGRRRSSGDRSARPARSTARSPEVASGEHDAAA